MVGNVVGVFDLVKKVKESYFDKVIFNFRYECEFIR